jgi:hypothetical protein
MMLYLDRMKKQPVAATKVEKAGKFVYFTVSQLEELRTHADRESRNVQGQIVLYVRRGLEEDRKKLRAVS